MGKQSFKHMLNMEPKIVMADGLPKDVMECLELEIAKCEEKTRLLRLLCLLSLTQNGLPKDYYNLITKEFVDAFGIEELLRILNLERAGLLKRQEKGVPFSVLRQTFKLVYDEINISVPNDIAYTYTGYAPLSIRLVERLIKTGWSVPESKSLK